MKHFAAEGGEGGELELTALNVLLILFEDFLPLSAFL